ncbi:MAG TPA: metallophosphoesterase [Tepidisphaeraceae bacterium]|nr:metallophosphoesterase [Tepidisphaeraceae bacterium]
MPRIISRREFIATTAALTGAAALPRALRADAGPAATDLRFFVIGDTHYLADKQSPGRLDARSADVTSKLIDTLNALPGTNIPDAAGGGTVGTPSGLIHAGDLIDSGDKSGGPYAAMHHTEWNGYVSDFGLTGKDGKLKTPVYEIHGNHDGPSGKGVPIDGIISRNKSRPGLTHISANGLHYSWDWGRVHFVCLGIVVGEVKSVTRRRRYNPLDSLDFLQDDLASKVGSSGRPVIVTHHIDIARNTGPCDPNAPFANKEWDACDVRAFYEAMKPFNVIALFYGHTHVRNVFKWDGNSAKATQGIDVFNVTKASHFNSDTQGFFYVHVTDGKLAVREYTTKNRWATGSWTPQVWAGPIRMTA